MNWLRLAGLLNQSPTIGCTVIGKQRNIIKNAAAYFALQWMPQDNHSKLRQKPRVHANWPSHVKAGLAAEACRCESGRSYRHQGPVQYKLLSPDKKSDLSLSPSHPPTYNRFHQCQERTPHDCSREFPKENWPKKSQVLTIPSTKPVQRECYSLTTTRGDMPGTQDTEAIGELPWCTKWI